MTGERDTAPALFSQRVSLALGALALFPATFSQSGGLLALGGFGLLSLGAFSGTRRFLTLGTTLLFLGVVLGATATTDALLPLLGAAGAIAAWDVAENAIGLGEQVGRDAPTRRAEIAHLGASVAVGLLAVGVGFTMYEVAWTGQPLPALIAFLFAAILLLLALRRTARPAPA